MAEVLFVCTGNRCRSPSAASLLRQQLGDAGRDDVTVLSAGTVGADVGPPRSLLRESRAFGIDLTAHVPRTIDRNAIQAADLAVGLAREHVRQMVLLVPTAFPRTYTLREIVRRGLRTRPRSDAEDLETWLARLHDGRRHADLLGDAPEDDVMDPLGGSRDDYRRMLTEVSALTKALRDLAWPTVNLPASGYGGPSDPLR
jgi:protein-tyrosine-phosphatase